MYFLIELTDTFGGEANYAWVTRVKVAANNLRHAVRKFSKDAGFTGRVRHDYSIPDELGTERYIIRGAAMCFFASAWSDDYHRDLRHETID
jgi:hypothetical protein